MLEIKFNLEKLILKFCSLNLSGGISCKLGFRWRFLTFKGLSTSGQHLLMLKRVITSHIRYKTIIADLNLDVNKEKDKHYSSFLSFFLSVSHFIFIFPSFYFSLSFYLSLFLFIIFFKWWHIFPVATLQRWSRRRLLHEEVAKVPFLPLTN